MVLNEYRFLGHFQRARLSILVVCCARGGRGIVPLL